MIPVSQPFLPPIDEYNSLISKLWDTKWLTNNGPYVQQLEDKLKSYLHVPSLQFVNNGTAALLLAIKALQIKKEVITTPFSFVATTTSILWENCQPVFVDIDPRTLCIDPDKIEEAITDKTEAILATHVYGIPCDVTRIEKIAKKHNLKVIYDAAHSFGVHIDGKSLLEFGDISTLSFHSTKLFHTVEGGAIINNIGDKLDQHLKLLRSFGFEGENYQTVGINAKNSEFHAAMGLCNLKYINQIILRRRMITEIYDGMLANWVEKPSIPEGVEYNYAYYPIIFENEQELISVMNKLKNNNIATRRYFNPSLNKLPYLENNSSCPISEDISKRILCLPLFSELHVCDVEKISKLIMEGLANESTDNRRGRLYRV
ncbi:DegT/DnrJ/EryC1/StrS family aminotransferase [Peribacillus glennii]|uniref:DegT/DnrJ/EryC1/StrS family aminotransferase n=1 Tax=Peribacillus glennii TaxID=2303991 RepID=A0A372LF86_9BACI|nr:DegT/DnrJ/EryC1/StrS family aminotransferase [Peribacillus glennii]RFU64739.1 DegT/DnrJ/EryC1/StrS family aminotransferase [Peribacillus glennii]